MGNKRVILFRILFAPTENKMSARRTGLRCRSPRIGASSAALGWRRAAGAEVSVTACVRR